jgi:virulence factor
MAQRVAVVGLGDIAAKAYLPLLAVRPGVELVVYNRSRAAVDIALARYRLQHGTTDLDELVGWKPAAAFVLTASESHAAIVERLLLAGADVLVEKPATLTSQGTQALAELADRNGRILMVGFNRRFAPLHVRAKALWGARGVGLCLFQKHRGNARHPDVLSNYIDDTIHVIDLVRFFCGEGSALQTAQRLKDGRLVDAVSVVGLATGGQAVIATSLEAGEWRESGALYGAGASLELDVFERLRWSEGGEERTWQESYASRWTPTLEARGFVAQIDHFFECVATRRQPATSAWDSVRTQKLLEDLAAQAR